MPSIRTVHPADCDCRACLAAAFRDSIGGESATVEDGDFSNLLPAYQETLVADALVDLVAAWDSKDPGHPDYVEPRIWLRRMELSVGYARQILADVSVRDRRLAPGPAPEERAGADAGGSLPAAGRVAA